MPEKHPALTSRAEWQALNDAKARLEHLPMRELFQQDPGRAQRLQAYPHCGYRLQTQNVKHVWFGWRTGEKRL